MNDRNSISQPGKANATSIATSTEGATAADASASGATGQTMATAQTSGLSILDVQTASSGPVAGDSVEVQSRAAVARPAPDPSQFTKLQAVALFTALPLDTDVLSALRANPRVHQNFNVAGEGVGPRSQVLGLLAQGASNTANGATTAVASIDLSRLPNNQDLLIGMFKPIASGNGFETLRFQVLVNRITRIDQSFTSLAGADAYFDGNTIDLGPIGGGGAGPLNLQFEMDISSHSGQGFEESFIFGNATLGSGVPEPSGLVILLSVGVGSLLRRRRR